MFSFGSDTPFMLLAKLKIKEDKVVEYLEIANKTEFSKGNWKLKNEYQNTDSYV